MNQRFRFFSQSFCTTNGFLLLFTLSLFASWACGVKAPPLPPLPVTPQQADRQEEEEKSPSPQLSPQASPSPSVGAKPAPKSPSKK
jgi:hypothetical protein